MQTKTKLGKDLGQIIIFLFIKKNEKTEEKENQNPKTPLRFPKRFG